MSKGKRDRDQNVVQTLRDWHNLHKILEGKAELAVRGEKLAQQRFFEAEDADIALHEIDQEFESQRLQLQQANQWADQAQIDKTGLYGELEMRNRVFRENQAKDCQENEELRRICCEETESSKTSKNW